ncbi:MAG TPA: hypothetical protein VFL86_14860 [Burkholderiaceae bacterium]|nr:hypothetical protein [Burkholderiaceae bacterium]
MPLSGNVSQIINPWNWFFSAMDSQLGLININLGKSPDPSLEQTILREVGTYGRQLGRLGEALEVLLNHVKLDDLDPDERKKINAFLYLQDEIAAVKKRARERPPQA